VTVVGSETSRPLEVSIKEHKYNLTQGQLEKTKLSQHTYKKTQNMFARSERLSD
jgi:hypothetical protein